MSRSIERLQRPFLGEYVHGLGPASADCWDRWDQMSGRCELENLPEPFEVHWTAEVRQLRPPVRPGRPAPLLMRLNRNPYGLKLPWVRREAYAERWEGIPDREPFSVVRQEAQALRERPAFASPAEDRYVMAAPPSLRHRRSR